MLIKYAFRFTHVIRAVFIYLYTYLPILRQFYFFFSRKACQHRCELHTHINLLSQDSAVVMFLQIIFTNFKGKRDQLLRQKFHFDQIKSAFYMQT